jgi:hypothetical protein
MIIKSRYKSAVGRREISSLSPIGVLAFILFVRKICKNSLPPPVFYDSGPSTVASLLLQKLPSQSASPNATSGGMMSTGIMHCFQSSVQYWEDP